MNSLKLEGVNFSNAEMTGAIFEGCDSKDANFTNADLRATKVHS